MASRDDGLGDAGDLVWRLALTEDDFGKPLTLVPIVIDPCEAEVLDPVALRERSNLMACFPYRQSAIANRFEERGDRIRAEDRGICLICQGFSFDSVPVSSVKWTVEQRS